MHAEPRFSGVRRPIGCPKMIEWNKKRFSCEACTKGHRSSKCGHLNRPLIEIKTKGRPSTQCPTCRKKRNSGIGHAHHKCKCGSEPIKPFVIRIYMTFENGLELQFLETKDCTVSYLQEKIRKKVPFEFSVKKEDVVYTNLLGLELRYAQEDLELELSSFLNNPCRCHYGQPCICASRVGDVTPESGESEAVLALSQLYSKPVPGCCESKIPAEKKFGGNSFTCVKGSGNTTCPSCANGCNCSTGCCG